jgi:hypothetical protein
MSHVNRTPEPKRPGYLHPWAAVARAEEAAQDEARARAAAEQEDFERELLQLRWEVKKLKLEHELWCFQQKCSPNQPRVPPGSSDGGQWTRMGGGQATSIGGSPMASRTRLADAGNRAGGSGQPILSDASPDPIRPGAQANVIPICIVGSSMITTDRFGNQNWWADYVCADGFTFRKFGTGGRVRGL